MKNLIVEVKISVKQTHSWNDENIIAQTDTIEGGDVLPENLVDLVNRLVESARFRSVRLCGLHVDSMQLSDSTVDSKEAS